MSTKSIRAFQARAGRKPAPSITPRCFGIGAAKTEPPPPPAATAEELLGQAESTRKRALLDLEQVPAWRELRRAEEMERAARSMLGAEVGS